ncbi:MAG: metallophosphoesterase [archaeon]|nr:MAG: metallophosphoesterase [archaeon]
MRILVIGDFHGHMPVFLNKIFKKEKPDLIVSQGDFSGNDRISKIFFKYYYAKNSRERKKIPKKIRNLKIKLERKSVESGIAILKKFKKLKKPFYAIRGNWDPVPYQWYYDIGGDSQIEKDPYLNKFNRVFEKGFELIDFKFKDLKDFVIVAGSSSTHPGKIDKKSLNRFLNKYKETDPVYAKRRIEIKKRQYHLREKRLIKAFQKARKSKKLTIFLTHNIPYNTKLDVIMAKNADKRAKGQHYGSYLDKVMIKRFKPNLVICGHMHENPGIIKIGKTTVVNPGASLDKRYAVIELGKNKIKSVKLRRVK